MMDTSMEAAAARKSGAGTRAAARRARLHRWVRKLHTWIGAWGAIAAVIFGLSGFVQNHRAMMKLPQGGSTEVSSVELAVPEAARASQQSLRDWLQQSQGIAFEGRPARGSGEGRGAAPRWTLSAGGARKTYQAEYHPGDATLVLRTSVQSPLATLIRLHKAVGGGMAWVLLSDSFAIAMAALGMSGLIMWGRGRSVRQMLLSIVGAAVIVLAVIVGSAVAWGAVRLP